MSLIALTQIKRITFKKNAHDRSTIGDPGSVIKVNGRECGTITENSRWGGNPEGDNRFRVRLQVGITPLKAHPLRWTWVTAKITFPTDKDARDCITFIFLNALIGPLKDRPYGDKGQTYTGELWIDDIA